MTTNREEASTFVLRAPPGHVGVNAAANSDDLSALRRHVRSWPEKEVVSHEWIAAVRVRGWVDPSPYRIELHVDVATLPRNQAGPSSATHM